MEWWDDAEADAIGAVSPPARGADFDNFRDVLNRHFYPARVEPLGAGAMTAPALSAIHLEHLTLAYVRFGAEATVDPGDILGYHVNVPLRGSVLSRCGDQREVANPTRAAVFSPHEHTLLPRWERDAIQICIKVSRASLESELTAMLHRSVTAPVRFQLGLDLASPSGRAWSGILMTLLQHCAAGTAGATIRSPVVEILERGLISSLLTLQHHSYSEVLLEERWPISSAHLRPVIALVDQQPETIHTVTDLARAAHVSVRALQAAFQRELGLGPMQYVRQVRLDRARADLLIGNVSVAAVAHHWGFGNLGRFASMYRERFGELPSEMRGG